ncbi:MAG: hypothetical protein R3E18_11655 [Sphingomonadaceae bacterium]
MGSFRTNCQGYRHISNGDVRALFEADWGVALDPEPGLRIPNMLDAAVDGSFKAIYIQGEDILQSDPTRNIVAAGLAAMDCVIVYDLPSTKPPITRMSSCPVRPSLRKTGPSPMRNGASSRCKR